MKQGLKEDTSRLAPALVEGRRQQTKVGQKLATNRKTRPDKTPRGMLTKLLAVVASLASAVVVRDAVEFRAELARGAP